MKLLSCIVGALLVSSAFAVCSRDIGGTPSTSADSTRRSSCSEAASSAGCSIPASTDTVTTNPLVLVARASESVAAGASETRYENDIVKIVFTESAKYYGKANEGPTGFAGGEAPKVLFGTSTTPIPANVFSAHSVNLDSLTSAAGCGWRHTYSLDWNQFLLSYSAVTTGPNKFQTANNNAYLRTLDGTIIRYDVDFSVVNYEWVTLYRNFGQPNQADISVERTIRHALPFSIKFQTQATIVSTSVQVYSNVVALAAIVSQSVTLADFNGNANAEILLYTSVQAPFVIDELRIFSGRDGVSGDTEGEVGDTVNGKAVNVFAYSSTTYGGASGVGATQVVDITGPTGKESGQAFVEGTGSTCKGTDAVCTQVWPLGLGITGSNGLVCDFTGTYTVYYTLKCNPHYAFVAPDDCPINLNSITSPASRIIPGGTTTVAGVATPNFFTLNIQTSNHCTQVVDTIGLEADLYTHGQPVNSDPSAILRGFGSVGVLDGETLQLGSTDYDGVTGRVLSTAPHKSSIPFPAYTYAPVAASGSGFYDPDGIKWGPSELDGPVTYDITDNLDLSGKTSFLNNQWVFGVALVKVSQATVVKASFDKLTISGFGSGLSSRIVVNNGAVTDAATVDSLNLAFVDDTTQVNINTPSRCIAYPYFFFKVSQSAFGIQSDGNLAIQFVGVIKVTYQNAASVDGEQLEKFVPFTYTMQADTKSQGQTVGASIGIGNGASTGASSTANSTFLGVSSSTAAGVALAVGVVVGLLVGLLVSATRRRPAPTKTESQVQLTNSAATSAV